MDYNLGLFSFLLLIMVVLPLSARIIQTGNGVKKGAQNLCVEGSWIKVGSFRFWKRSECVKRRQMTPQPTLHDGLWPQRPGLRNSGEKKNVTGKPTSTVDLELILPSLEGGPQRNKTYNPIYGHEPYWVSGDWVFDKDPYKKDSALYMCNVRCPTMYTEYGKVCGRNRHFEYKSFGSYCQLRNADCTNLDRWYVVYRGTCDRQLDPYNRHFIVDKAKWIITNFMSVYPDYNTKNVGFCKDCPEKFLTQRVTSEF